MNTRSKYIDAVMDVTSGEAWEIVKESLEGEIRDLQVRALGAKTWEDVCELRGQAQAYIVIYNMRENAKLEKTQDAL